MAIHVVGLGMDPESLPENHAAVIDEAQVLVGGRRLLALFDDHPADKITVSAHLDDVMRSVAVHDNAGKDVVVLADGDALFFGIGRRLVEHFGPENLVFLPNVTALQTAAARLRVPWQDAVAVSLHGRDDYGPLFSALMGATWVAVFTDARNIPSAIAQALMDRGAEGFVMWVFENLGSEDERFGKFTLEEVSHRNFSSLNLVMIERTAPPEKTLRLGIPDEEFSRDTVLTKRPVRSAGLAALQLAPGQTFWDLGSGCGAMSVEACGLMRQGRILAVEKHSERVTFIRENARKFGALLVEPCYDSMPSVLKDLPTPDRIFIGGGLSRESGLLDAACDRLPPGGIIVVHCVLFGSLERVRRCFEARQWPFEILHVQASVSSDLAGDLRLEPLNPVFIITAERPPAERHARR